MPRTPNGNKRRRPNDSDAPPPGPPPQALVELLRSDSSVLEYFSSLQACLDSDVQKWKNRAHQYKEEAKDLRRQLEEARQQKTSKPPRKRRGKSNNASRTPQSRQKDDSEEGASSDEEKVSPRAKVSDSKPPARDNVDDSAFVLSSSDDDGTVEAAATPMQEQDSVPDWTIYGLLLEAYNNLRQLGVALVVEEVVESEKDTGNENQTSDDASENEPRFIRCSDHDVVADLMHALHTLTRIQLQMKDATMHPPFSADGDFIPCANVESHPASKGKECTLQAISVMDVYCTNMSDSQWNKLLPPGADEAIRVGMRDRRHLVDGLLSSLLGEISDAWAVADRSSRLANTALHYEASTNDEITPFVGQYGTKSQGRLSALAEKCLLAEVVSRILYQQDEHQEVASLTWRYILSAVPSFGVEDYPRLPPVLSLCVLESLLRPYGQSELLQLFPLESSKDKGSSLMHHGIILAVHSTVRVWKMRLASSDDRITDISRVELACYNRLLASQFSWLSNSSDEKSLDAYCSEAQILLNGALNHGRVSGETQSSTRKVEASLAVQLALIIMGDTISVLKLFFDAKQHFDADDSWIPLACCSAFRQLQVRQIDALRARQGSLVMASAALTPSVSDQLTSLVYGLRGPYGPVPNGVDTIMKCCIQLSDAEHIHKLLLWVAGCVLTDSDRGSLATVISRCLGTSFAEVGRAPVVRVINLERRPDRMKTFMAQAQVERILVSKAVARLDVDDDQNYSPAASTSVDFDTKFVWGMHAFDGQGGMVEVVSRLSKEIGESRELSAFVESHWRPNDLKAFDKDARNDEKLVLLSPSERACALSHIASWKGVYRSLSLWQQSQEKTLGGLSFPFMISGYARGKPLLRSNEHTSPTPVCIILEDDAILVDRFADRLSSLLEELPRDFHFCSIGYSRPKTAPIAMYSTHLGIPSCIWYLTGYIISLDGAKHLLESLPVRGPVDSWIGLKMCANWDNVFGQAMGVGARASAATAELPSRKDLARILKFRAFAALVPLCSQKVDTATSTTVGRSWRQRDTDVTYSGNL